MFFLCSQPDIYTQFGCVYAWRLRRRNTRWVICRNGQRGKLQSSFKWIFVDSCIRTSRIYSKTHEWVSIYILFCIVSVFGLNKYYLVPMHMDSVVIFLFPFLFAITAKWIFLLPCFVDTCLRRFVGKCDHTYIDIYSRRWHMRSGDPFPHIIFFNIFHSEKSTKCRKIAEWTEEKLGRNEIRTYKCGRYISGYMESEPSSYRKRTNKNHPKERIEYFFFYPSNFNNRFALAFITHILCISAPTRCRPTITDTPTPFSSIDRLNLIRIERINKFMAPEFILMPPPQIFDRLTV